MKPQQFEKVFWVTALLGVFAIFSGNAWASAGRCIYPASGTGMGGTGAIARSSGIGGTGTPIAGNIISSQGAVKAQNGERSRNLVAGDAVCVGETIVTAQSASAKIRMVDDGTVTVRPQTEFKIEQFAYNDSENDSSLFDLFKGSLRVVTGKLGHKHPQNDLIRTPLALVGVRGTDHEVAVIQPGQGGSNPAGVYDKVNSGVTFIKTSAGEVDIHPDQVGFAGGTHELPVLLHEIPDFYGVAESHTEGHSEHGDAEDAQMEKGGIEHSDEHGGPESGNSGESPNFELPDVGGGMEMPETPDIPEGTSSEGGD